MISRRPLMMTLSALALTSCGAIPTQYVPNGYTYHDSTPLSSPAPTRPWLDEAAHPNLDNIGDNTAAWQGAVYELINPLPNTITAANGPITLKPAGTVTPADQALDHYLRQGLISYGYVVNPTPDMPGTVLVYDAAPLSDPEYRKMAVAKFGKEFVKKDDMKGMYYLTLDVKSPDGKKTVASQASIGVFPHEKSEYMRWPGFANQPVQGKAASRPPVYETRD